MRGPTAAVVISLCCAANISAQSAPDFSGTWMLDAPNSVSAGEPIRPGDERPKIQPPKRIKYVRPIHPAEGNWLPLFSRIAGKVVIEAIIDETGGVADAVVIMSVPALDHAALDAVRRWKYAPTLRDGVPVPVIMRATATFSLEGVEPTPATPTGNTVLGITIKQDAGSLALTRHTSHGPEALVYRFDGTQSWNRMPTAGGGTAERVCRSHWEGARLVTTLTSPNQTETRYLEGGTMVVEVVTPGEPGADPKVTKQIYRKAG